MYRVFHRTWWRINPDWPNGLEPHAGRKVLIGLASSEEKAQVMCRKYNQAMYSKYNTENKANKLSRKAEYEDA